MGCSHIIGILIVQQGLASVHLDGFFSVTASKVYKFPFGNRERNPLPVLKLQVMVMKIGSQKIFHITLILEFAFNSSFLIHTEAVHCF